MPSVPAAPVRFSTTACWPVVRVMCSASSRAPRSPMPPAANPVTMRTGLLGQSCADAALRTEHRKPKQGRRHQPHDHSCPPGFRSSCRRAYTGRTFRLLAQPAFQCVPVPAAQIRRRVVRALQERHQRRLRLARRPHRVIGQDEFAELLRPERRGRPDRAPRQNPPAPDRHRNRTPDSRSPRRPARSPRSTPRANRPRAPPRPAGSAPRPDAAAPAGRKSASPRGRSCPRRNAPGSPCRESPCGNARTPRRERSSTRQNRSA